MSLNQSTAELAAKYLPLAKEILANLPDHLEDFLMKTSLLERLTGSLCDALTGRENGGETLAELARQNLFINPLDDHQQWYSFHPLFADLLRERLRTGFPDEVKDLHRRAALWLAEHGHPLEAIQQAAQGEAMIVGRGGQMILRDPDTGERGLTGHPVLVIGHSFDYGTHRSGSGVVCQPAG